MKSLAALILLPLTLGLPSAAALAGAGPPGHSHETFSAGEPGNPKKPARVVLITMREGDGKMLFIPDRVEVRRGEQIRF
ncbi:MAG: copper resistance protein, partial [Pseudolabrys sp.]